MTGQLNSWSEDNSRLYRLIAPVAVPARAEQIATLLSLLPFERDAEFHAVDVGAGEGILSACLLASCPRRQLPPSTARRICERKYSGGWPDLARAAR